MPELAEVEYFKRQWNAGIGHRVIKITLHADKRVFRGTDTCVLREELAEARLMTSEARGKRMLFRFSNENWLGLHLGMSGKIQTAETDFRPKARSSCFVSASARPCVHRCAAIWPDTIPSRQNRTALVGERCAGDCVG